MGISIKSGLRVRIEELKGDNAPRPLPLSSGFSVGKTYEILGMHVPSESSEAFLILKNDRDEIWFVSNRHVRLVEPRATPELQNGRAHGMARDGRGPLT